MSDLPNVAFGPHATDQLRRGYAAWAHPEGATVESPATEYVPASAIEEANRLLAQWTTAADYDRERTTPASKEAHDLWARIDDKPHFALPTIQAVLDERDAANEALRVANEENKRLTDALHNARSRAWSHVLAGHEPSRRTVDHIDAALAPKEPSDV